MKRVLLSIACLLLLACDTRTGPELVVEKSFAAIKANDWAAYKEIMNSAAIIFLIVLSP